MNWINKQKDSRRIFIDELINLSAKDDKVCLIVPDVGFAYIEEYKEIFPHRYWNLGATEPSSMAEVAGMAIEGMKPYIYSMIPFVTFRVLELIRNAIVKHNANVKIIGVIGSSAYHMLGFSHNMIFEDEDLYHLKPYMDCYFPKNNAEVEGVIKISYEINKPCYIRL